MIRSQWRLGSRATISAFADNAAWCANAVETVFSFVQSYKLWYSWFLSTPVFLALNLMAIAPAMTLLLTGGHPERALPFFADHLLVFTIGWPGAVYMLILLWLANEPLLPSAVIRISDSEGFFSSTKIIVIAAVVQAVAAGLYIIVTVAKWAQNPNP